MECRIKPFKPRLVTWNAEQNPIKPRLVAWNAEQPPIKPRLMAWNAEQNPLNLDWWPVIHNKTHLT